MELIKHVIDAESVYFPKFVKEVDRHNYALIGFKDSLPVLSNKMDSNLNKDLVIKKTVKIETNSSTGQKFILLNGKKIKILAESELPKNSQIVKIASLQHLSPPEKIRIPRLEKPPKVIRRLPYLLPRGVSNNITEIKPVQLIGNKIKNIPVPVSVAAHIVVSGPDKSGVNADNKNMVTTENIGGKHITVNTKLLNNFICESNTKGVQCAALDLTKNCETTLTNSPTMKEDKGSQVELNICHKEVQTDRQTDFFDLAGYLFDSSSRTPIATKTLLDIDNLSDMCNSNADFTNLPIPAKAIIDIDQEFKSPVTNREENFFKELRAALQVDDRGNMPIHVGVLANDLKLVKRSLFILQILKQSIDIRNHDELTPLQLAIVNDSSLEIICYLLQNGANINVTDADGNSVLHYAVEYERTEALKNLLNFTGQQKVNLNLHNHEGLTPLMICCLNSFHDCAECLLENSADPNVRDQISGRTALFHAAEVHDVDMVEMLLQFDADTKIKNFFGTSPHDAMYEIEDMPEPIKFMILGKTSKRKINDDTRPSKFVKKVDVNRVRLKTYARIQKIRYSDLKSISRTVNVNY